MNPKKNLVAALAILLVGVFVPVSHAQPATKPTTASTRPSGTERFEKEIAAYEAADRDNPPPKGAILFTGSSTIRGWKSLASDFPDRVVLNRGFGGSQITDATHFADRIIFPYEPKMIVFRSGGNDIHAGKTAEQVFEDYKAFVAKVRTRLPQVPIVFISWAPAPSRWEERQTNKRFNDFVQEYTRATPRLKYVETYDTTITPDGQPRMELFVKDRLHFNEAGYKVLAERVRPALAP